MYFGILFFLVVILDQLTKLWVVHHFILYESMEIIPGLFNLTYLTNTGGKHSKEYKQVTDITGIRNAKPYSYGKKNVFLTARLMRGQKRYLTEKAKTKGVAIGWQYLGGISLGLLKPYYLNLQRQADPANPQDFSTRAEKYSLENRDVFLDSRAIVGGASFWKGIGETSILPGLHGRLGVLFDWGAFDATSKSVDIGVMIDVFPKAVPIMIDAKNYPFFLNLYINFQFGKRS
ncbi:MAG TPA: hypothetical protein ENK85_07395 [Saprospiraceae bacterium]|nr:hypothetical protein [Saprospiraceae bacterium]